MKTLAYENEIYMQVTPTSAIRPQGKDRLQILTIDEDGTITYKSRTCRPDVKTVVEGIFTKGILNK
jgi:hypothetical protein